jgi:alpha-L-fucosidase
MRFYTVLVYLLSLKLVTFCLKAQSLSPTPYGPTPSARQLLSEHEELYGFIHFGVNTFTDKEWGEGSEKESVFNPTDFNAEQIVQAFKEGGFKGVILTCKHHDGFCLWPSAYTEHSVKNSPWRGGKGDVVKEISEACRRLGMRFGIYLSPWDRNSAFYGKPDYLIYYKNQLRELLTHYGPIFEVWLDGANGGKGYYGGANEKRSVDATTYYEWPNAWVSLIRDLQPNCIIHSDFGPDNRWGGNESGTQPMNSWATLKNKELTFNTKNTQRNKTGERPGDLWVPAESDVSIRHGWFYHESEVSTVKSADALFELYCQSVGRGSNLLLNVPPDKRGQLAAQDVASLKAFKDLKDKLFAHNLLSTAQIVASNVRGNASEFSADQLKNDASLGYWSTDDSVKEASVIFDWVTPITYNLINIQEYIQLGQRIDAFKVEHWDTTHWVLDTQGESIGQRRLFKGSTITTQRVRLTLMHAAACPAISHFGLYYNKN